MAKDVFAFAHRRGGNGRMEVVRGAYHHGFQVMLLFQPTRESRCRLHRLETCRSAAALRSRHQQSAKTLVSRSMAEMGLRLWLKAHFKTFVALSKKAEGLAWKIASNVGRAMPRKYVQLHFVP